MRWSQEAAAQIMAHCSYFGEGAVKKMEMKPDRIKIRLSWHTISLVCTSDSHIHIMVNSVAYGRECTTYGYKQESGLIANWVDYHWWKAIDKLVADDREITLKIQEHTDHSTSLDNLVAELRKIKFHPVWMDHNTLAATFGRYPDDGGGLIQSDGRTVEVSDTDGDVPEAIRVFAELHRMKLIVK